MSLKVDKVQIEEIKIRKTPELDAIVKLMAQNGISDGYSLLPTSTKHKVSMQLNNTYSAFANAIRRTLVEDIPVWSLGVHETDILTDDEFISGMNDVLVKNLGLVPIMQTGKVIDAPDKYDLYLYVFNNTNEIIDVKASDINIVLKTTKKSKKKGGAQKETDVDNTTVDEDADIDEDNATVDVDADIDLDTEIELDNKTNASTKKEFNLIPDDNILLMRLRPGKYLKLRNIFPQSGTSAQDASKYSLLNNVSYEPLDMNPYDQFTGKGTRSIEHDCKSFLLEFSTCGNIEPKQVIQLAHKKLVSNLEDIRKKIQLYIDKGITSYYSGQDCEVTLQDEVYNFKFVGHYISELFMIAMNCLKLDDNVPFCAATVERYDSVVGLLRIKHADFTKLLLKSIDVCIKDLDIFLDAF